MSVRGNPAGRGSDHRRACRLARILVLAAWVAGMGVLALPPPVEARGGAGVGGGGARMGTASVGAANRAVGAAGRPAQLPAGSGADWPGRPPDPPDRGNDGWGWYSGYAYGSSGNADREAQDDSAIDVDGAIAAAAAAAAAATVAVAAAPATGSVVYQLEPGCSTVERKGAYYRYCGGVYYQEQLDGDRVAYLVVNP